MSTSVVSGRNTSPVFQLCEHVFGQEDDNGTLIGSFKRLTTVRIEDSRKLLLEKRLPDNSQLSSDASKEISSSRTCIANGLQMWSNLFATLR